MFPSIRYKYFIQISLFNYFKDKKTLSFCSKFKNEINKVQKEKGMDFSWSSRLTEQKAFSDSWTNYQKDKMADHFSCEKNSFILQWTSHAPKTLYLFVSWIWTTLVRQEYRKEKWYDLLIRSCLDTQCALLIFDLSFFS